MNELTKNNETDIDSGLEEKELEDLDFKLFSARTRSKEEVDEFHEYVLMEDINEEKHYFLDFIRSCIESFHDHNSITYKLLWQIKTIQNWCREHRIDFLSILLDEDYNLYMSLRDDDLKRLRELTLEIECMMSRSSKR